MTSVSGNQCQVRKLCTYPQQTQKSSGAQLSARLLLNPRRFLVRSKGPWATSAPAEDLATEEATVPEAVPPVESPAVFAVGFRAEHLAEWWPERLPHPSPILYPETHRLKSRNA